MPTLVKKVGQWWTVYTHHFRERLAERANRDELPKSALKTIWILVDANQKGYFQYLNHYLLCHKKYSNTRKRWELELISLVPMTWESGCKRHVPGAKYLGVLHD